MEYFDTHCHLDFPEFDHDREEVMVQCDQLGVRYILIPAVDCSNWDRVIGTASLRDSYYFALGLHPMFMSQHESIHLEQLSNYLEKHQPVAIGEIGLDFYHGDKDRDTQLQYFEAQLDLAKKYSLPVVLHVRKAHDDVLKLLRKKKLIGGFVHAFSGSEQQAFQYIDLNFKLGFGGTITYDRSTKLKTILKKIPLTAFVLETDAPDMSPAWDRGNRNQPNNIPRIFELITQILNVDAMELSRTLVLNSKQTLQLI